MAEIDTGGMKAAELTDEQIAQLRQAEQKINGTAGNKQEIYLLAVTRH
ncbi:MAG: hypothetical protein K6T29_01705 [Peptococcaceae bacterium]|nr:hypothetical protein [Peptococcaceae bacterium]